MGIESREDSRTLIVNNNYPDVNDTERKQRRCRENRNGNHRRPSTRTLLREGSDRNPPTASPRATTKQNRSSGACSSKGGALIATATSTPSSPVPSQNQGQGKEDTTTKPTIDERHNVGGYFLLQVPMNKCAQTETETKLLFMAYAKNIREVRTRMCWL
eukprot:jgi/Psemu1/57859/gm1.57859_g